METESDDIATVDPEIVRGELFKCKEKEAKKKCDRLIIAGR